MTKDKNRKVFVIDTNVLIHKSDAILSFKQSDVVIPVWVLEELDKLKSFSDERGRSARHAVRFLDQVCSHGDISKGVKIENGIKVRVDVKEHKHPDHSLLKDKPDNKIIFSALNLQEKGEMVFFVSKDINARVKASAMGIKAVDYKKQTVNIKDFYPGSKEYTAENTNPSAAEIFKNYGRADWEEKLLQNQYVIINKDEKTSLGRYDAEASVINKITYNGESISGINPLNERQKIAFDMLLDDSLKIVSLVGKAGTGKTLLAIASGIRKVLVDKKYNRVLVSRPVIPMGKDIGYLPGDKEEKMSHWMQPIFDNLSQIIEAVPDKQEQKNMENLVKNKQIEIEALTYIRGRSLPNQYIIIDEAQNLTPHEIKTVVSRAGENTKLILTGDPDQIDNPYLDASSNGLTYLVEAFKGQKLFGHILLEKTERSALSDLAAKLL